MAYLYDLWIPDPSCDKINRIIKEEAGVTITSEHKPMAVCVHSNQSDVYFVNAGANTIKYKNGVALTVAQTAQGTVSRYRDGVHMDDIAVGKTPMGIAEAPDGSLYVTNYKSNTVSKIYNNRVVKTISVGTGPRGVAVTPKGVVYVTNYLASTVTKIVNDVPTGDITVAWNPYGICADRNENVYVCCSGSNVVTKIKDITKLKDITVGKVPYGICIDMNGTLWVTNYYSNTISKIVNDVAVNNGIIVGKGPYGIGIDRDNEVFVTNYLDGTISKVVDDVETIKISVTNNPCGFGDFTGMQAYYLFIYGTGGTGQTKAIGYDDLDPALQRKLDSLTPTTFPISDSLISHDGDANYTTVQEALDHLLNPDPVIESLTLNQYEYEKGFVVNSLTLNWTLNKEVATQTITGYGTVDAALRTKTLNGIGLTADSKFVLTVTDAKGKTATANASIKFLLSNYIGALANDAPSNAELLTLKSILSKDANITNQYVNASGGKYLYIAVPTTYGLDRSRIMVGDRIFTDWTTSTITLTNSNGYASSYTLFKSNRIQTGSDIKIDTIV